ncbi:MAG: DNA polymerase III subunit alpha, partial [Exilispira sp.]
NKTLIEFSKSYGLDIVATNDNHYLEEEDAEKHNILLAIQTQATIDEDDRFSFNGSGYFFKSYEQMLQIFGDYPESLQNTLKIMEMCNVNFKFGEISLPKFPIEKDYTEDTLLKKLAEEGLKKRYPQITEEIKERFNYEFKIISSKKFSGYFLIVWDLINWAKNNNILVGPGRGSAGGSILAYALGITDIDPLKHNLMFERFLNPERTNMPDIDIDFQDIERPNVIEYIKNRYGKDHVAAIGAFSQLKAKQAIKDVARVLKISASEANKITSIINSDSLEEEIKTNETFKSVMESNELYKKCLDYALFVEGLFRQTTIHAAGVVITQNPVIEELPLMISSDSNMIVSQFEKDTVERLGYLKMDILGIKYLTIIKDTFEYIEKRYNKKISLNDIPLDDEKTYKLLCSGNTSGCFQVEAAGFTRMLKQLKPQNIEDVTAALALYRPGPLKSGYVATYIDRKNNPEKIQYPFEELKSVLSETYGVIVYQEQIMKISMILSGFSGAEADTLRKAVAKKKGDLMEKMKNKFIEKAVKNGKDEAKVRQLFDDINNFADYCFNKSHSAAYAYLTIYTAYLKSHYPVEFMTALIKNNIDDLEKVSIYVRNAKNMGISFVCPSVNHSGINFEIIDGKIVYGLSAIKGVGESAANIIVLERLKNGEYKDFLDFLLRIDLQKINKKIVEALIQSGAFDWTSFDRIALLKAYDELVEYSLTKKNDDGATLFEESNNKDFEKNYQISLISKYSNIGELNIAIEDKIYQYARWEAQLCGLPLKSDPLEKFYKQIEIINPKNFPSFMENLKPNENRQIIGYIENVISKTKQNGKNGIYYIIKIFTGYESIELFFFPSEDIDPSFYQNMLKTFIPRVFLISCKEYNSYDNKVEKKVNIIDIKTIENLKMPSIKEFLITISPYASEEDISNLIQFFNKNSGNCPIKIRFTDIEGYLELTSIKISANDNIIQKLQEFDFIDDVIPSFS